jgi:hypothetical protein
VSVIIAPRSTDDRPTPGTELLARVRRFLDAHRHPNIDLIVIGPEYVRTDVTVNVVITDINRAGDVEAAVVSSLRRFLHPISGNTDQGGWDFGREPKESDLYSIIEEIPGVDHVRSLSIDRVPDREGAQLAGRFLIYTGEPHVTITLGD